MILFNKMKIGNEAVFVLPPTVASEGSADGVRVRLRRAHEEDRVVLPDCLARPDLSTAAAHLARVQLTEGAAAAARDAELEDSRVGLADCGDCRAVQRPWPVRVHPGRVQVQGPSPHTAVMDSSPVLAPLTAARECLEVGDLPSHAVEDVARVAVAHDVISAPPPIILDHNAIVLVSYVAYCSEYLDYLVLYIGRYSPQCTNGPSGSLIRTIAL